MKTADESGSLVHAVLAAAVKQLMFGGAGGAPPRTLEMAALLVFNGAGSFTRLRG